MRRTATTGCGIRMDLVLFLQSVECPQVTQFADTMDAVNIQPTNFVYQGGDDCIAIKPRSYNIDIEDVTCVGGNGIAIGSLDQYLEDSNVENVRVDKLNVAPLQTDYCL